MSDRPAARSPFVLAVIQVRIGSTRLPGKSMLDIGGTPLLGHVIRRARACPRIDAVMIATTLESSDEPLVEYARELGVDAYRGSAEDVLDRFYQAIQGRLADLIVRVTADDPFKDPAVAERLITHLLEHAELDYVSNTIEPTYPEGLDLEVFTRDALAKAWREATQPSEREHVTPYIWKHPDIFRVANLRHERDLSHLRWTIDYEADLRFAREIQARLGHLGLFGMNPILRLLEEEPALCALNSGIERNQGYLRSLENAGQQPSGNGILK